jgi:hypothetical protein
LADNNLAAIADMGLAEQKAIQCPAQDIGLLILGDTLFFGDTLSLARWATMRLP